MNTHIFSGHIQLPEGMCFFSDNQIASIVMEIDMCSGQIVNCSLPENCCSHDESIEQAVRGKKIDTDFSRLVESIVDRVHGILKPSFMQSLNEILTCYLCVKGN